MDSLHVFTNKNVALTCQNLQSSQHYAVKASYAYQFISPEMFSQMWFPIETAGYINYILKYETSYAIV